MDEFEISAGKATNYTMNFDADWASDVGHLDFAGTGSINSSEDGCIPRAVVPALTIEVQADTETVTNDLVVTVSIPENTESYYSTDLTTWTKFEGTLHLYQNGLYYFKAVGEMSVESPHVSLNVTNIDTVAPESPTASANITAVTDQNVIVTATFSDDTVVKEFSLDNENWQTYTSGIVFEQNGVVYFRGRDAAGNYSSVTTYEVSNIQSAAPTTVISGNFVVSSGTVLRNAIVEEYGNVFVEYGGSVSSTTVNERGAVILSAGATADQTTINSSGALHVYSGGVASQTTVNQSGYFGIGLGATAYDTTIDYAGALTVWGGGVVSRNTLNTWGAIILSSGAVANETTVNSLGGLHVYSGATASNTTIKEGGILGAGLGATVYETELDSFGSATLWGGAVASKTEIGYAAEMTVLSGGLADTNVIDTWGAIILQNGAIGNSTTILANGGYHIFDGAVAFTTMVTSGAFLGIGLGGTVYNLDIQQGAGATFYDGSILRGWNDFAGIVSVNAALDAAGSMINFDITERSANDSLIVSNAGSIAGASYFVTVDATTGDGRHYLAGNAANIASVTITGTSSILTTNGDALTLNGTTYDLGLDAYNNLFLDISRVANNLDLEPCSGLSPDEAANDLENTDLGIWDDGGKFTCSTADLVGNEERRDTGLLAIV